MTLLMGVMVARAIVVVLTVAKGILLDVGGGSHVVNIVVMVTTQ
jgi:hypothetical protein